MEIECDCDTFPAPPLVRAVDNCDESVMVNYEFERINGTSLDNYTLIRRWTAVDSSGNSVEHVQTITVKDSEPPVLTAQPSNAFVQCDNIPQPRSVRARDNCDEDVELVFEESVTQGNSDCFQVRTITRTWSATDRTGNSVSHTQVIQVDDSKPPEYLEDEYQLCLFPPDGNYVSFPDVSDSLLTVHDDCSPTVHVEFLGCNSSQPAQAIDTSPGFDQHCHYNEVQDTLYVKADRSDFVHAGRTYTLWAQAADECGNSKTVRKTFWVPHAAADIDDTADVCFSSDSPTFEL
jgi:hypothetical protein